MVAASAGALALGAAVLALALRTPGGESEAGSGAAVPPAAPPAAVTKDRPPSVAPAPPAPPVVPPAPEPPAAPAAATVTIEIETTPSGARVLDAADGRLLGTTPLRQQVERRPGGELQIKIERKGYQTRTVAVPLGQDFRSDLALDPTPPGGARPPLRGPSQSGERIIKL